MTPVKAVASGLALCTLILGLAVASNAMLDRYLLRKPAASAAAIDAKEPVAAGEVNASGSGACMDASGAKRNWPWANAPTLWPDCKDDAGPPVPAKEK